MGRVTLSQSWTIAIAFGAETAHRDTYGVEPICLVLPIDLDIRFFRLLLIDRITFSDCSRWRARPRGTRDAGVLTVQNRCLYAQRMPAESHGRHLRAFAEPAWRARCSTVSRANHSRPSR